MKNSSSNRAFMLHSRCKNTQFWLQCTKGWTKTLAKLRCKNKRNTFSKLSMFQLRNNWLQLIKNIGKVLWNLENTKNNFLYAFGTGKLLNWEVLVWILLKKQLHSLEFHSLCNIKARFDEELFIILIPDFFCRKVRVSKSSKRACFVVTLIRLTKPPPMDIFVTLPNLEPDIWSTFKKMDL